MKKEEVLGTKQLCMTAMLTAVAIILGAMSLRVGTGVKLSFKFLPVVLTSVLYGPIWGGICGGLSDLLSYFFNAGGSALMPQITFVEFLYGFSFGVFLYKAEGMNKNTIFRASLCILLNTVLLSWLVMGFILKDIMGMDYMKVLIMRIPSVAVNMILRFFGVFVILKGMSKIRNIIGK